MDIDVENLTWNIFFKKKTLLLMQNSISRNNTIYTSVFISWFPDYLLLFIPRNYENSDCIFFIFFKDRISFFEFPASSKISLDLKYLTVWQRGFLAMKQPKIMLYHVVSVRFFEGSHTRIIPTNNVLRFPQLLFYHSELSYYIYLSEYQYFVTIRP